MPSHVVRALVLLFAATLFFSAGASARDEVLRVGAEGPEVVLAQHFLHQLGLLTVSPDGIFGQKTLEAVKQFQRERGLAADGIVGPRTWAELQSAVLEQTARVHVVRSGDTLWGIARTYGVSVETIVRVNDIAQPSLIRPGEEVLVPRSDRESAVRPVLVEIVHWNEAKEIYSNFKVITVTDVRTGKSFRARRFYGHLHADTEPLTAEDAATLREIYGGWSWERRPIIVEVDGRRIAASMNGMPHGQGSIAENGFPGHFCIHFLGSRIHQSGKIDLAHQAAVLEAAGYKVNGLWLARNL